MNDMKTEFTRIQNEIIVAVEKYLAEGDSFDDAIMYAGHDLGMKVWYVKETYVSYITMVILAK